MLLIESPFVGSTPTLTAKKPFRNEGFFLTQTFILPIFYKKKNMSRLDELKKQYPELNVTMFDMMTRLDTSKSYKYLPLLCKIFGQRFNPKKLWQNKNDYLSGMLEIQAILMNKSISTDNLTDGQMYYIANYFTEHFSNDTYQTLKEFMGYMEKDQIENKDVSTYKDLEDIRGAVTLASMKELTKDLEGQVIKEYEDERWVVVRPLTFSASAKYGASTRWCTTYQKEKNYFEKYWRRGILVYFINKQTGYKFAGYKGIDGDSEFSFWNAEDSRTDYLEVDADDYLFPIVRKIFKSEQTNKNLCSDEIQEQVHTECLTGYEKMRVEFSYSTTEEIPVEQPMEETRMEQPTQTHNYQREINTLRELINDIDMTDEIDNVPTMRA
jgi:hypothetical protein